MIPECCFLGTAEVAARQVVEPGGCAKRECMAGAVLAALTLSAHSANLPWVDSCFLSCSLPNWHTATAAIPCMNIDKCRLISSFTLQEIL